MNAENKSGDGDGHDSGEFDRGKVEPRIITTPQGGFRSVRDISEDSTVVQITYFDKHGNEYKNLSAWRRHLFFYRIRDFFCRIFHWFVRKL